MPFRVAVKHEDRKHPDSALFQVGDVHDDRAPADEALKAAQDRFPVKRGYQYRVQELVPSKDGEQRWKDLKG